MRPAAALLAALLLTAPVARANPDMVRVRPAPVTVVGSPAEVALDAVRSIRLSPGSTLEHEQTWHAPDGGRIVRLVQRHRGLPVVDAVVNVRLARDGSVKRIVSTAVELPEVPSTPVVDRDTAIGLAKAAVNEPQPVGPGRAALVVLRSGHLAWHVPVPTILPRAYAVRVDAVTGEVLSVEDRARTAAQANVFPNARTAFEARRSDRSFDTSKLERVTLGGLASTAEGAFLNDPADTSAEIVAFNCCPHAECDTTGPLFTRVGTLTIPQLPMPVEYDLAWCDERQVAAADASGDFLYEPAVEPDPDPNIIGPQPSDGDPFAEVHAYDAARRMLDYMQALDPQFTLGPKAAPLHVTANYLFPDFQNASFNIVPDTSTNPPSAKLSVTAGTAMRFSNAMFMPADSTEGLGIPIPGFDRSYDSVILFQGTNADFAYDASVVAHELSHGTVNATAKLVDWARDDWGVIDAPGAMNEGFADYWAAALTGNPIIGEYVGELEGIGEGSIRRLDNDSSCPTLIRGEVHNDSLHFSAALWAARSAVATTQAQRLAFDRGVLAAMRSMSAISNFDDAAALLVEEVEDALPGAGPVLEKAFADRAVTGCERYLDLTPDDSITNLIIAPARVPWVSGAPSPVQFRLPLPAGTTKFAITTKVAQGLDVGSIPGVGGGGGGQNGPSLRLLVKNDARLTFKYAASDVSSDRDQQVEFLTSGGDPTATVTLDAGCGKDVFVSIVNRTKNNPETLSVISVTHTIDEAIAEGCQPVDPPDAGEPDDGGGVGGGCGCGASSVPALGLLALVGLSRRRRLRA